MFEKIVIIYILINLISIMLFGIDKLKAIHHQWRISEKSLLLCALFGPLGGLLGMLLWHHKIRKPLFYILVPLFILLHILLLYLQITKHYISL